MPRVDDRLKTAVLFLVGLAISVGAIQLGLPRLLSPGDEIAARTGRQGVVIAIGLALLLWVVLAERRPLASIGVKTPGWGTLGWGVAGAVALIASFMLCYALLLPALGMSQDREGAARIVANPIWLQLLIITVAAVVEEIVFRGYLIERVEDVGGGKWLALALSILAFTVAHAGGWALSQLIVVVFGAVIMGLLYLWKRDLIMVMIAHWLADAVGFGLANLAARAPG